jgi:hypothetical protein
VPRTILFVGLAVLAGCCTTVAAPPHYVRESWAKEPLRQAEIECYDYVNSGRGLDSNIYHCMKSKGWQQVSGN